MRAIMLLDFSLRPLLSILVTQKELGVDSFKLFDSLFPERDTNSALTLSEERFDDLEETVSNELCCCFWRILFHKSVEYGVQQHEFGSLVCQWMNNIVD